MGRSVASVLGEGLSATPEDVWASEIRDYLLGRLSARNRNELLRHVQQTTLEHPPILRWWIFEGKQYAPFGGSLAASFDFALRMAQRLVRTFNPLTRISDRADGVVDWARTLARGASGIRPEYVVRSSGVGLGDDEHAALQGWASWIRSEWAAYASQWKIERHLDWAEFGSADGGPFTEDRLRRWAHVARRSRWPFLRDVVAESLRPALEPEDLNRIPLPSAREKLFELLCLVRIARALAPLPLELRWLQDQDTYNAVDLDGMTCRYQEPLRREAVLATLDYVGALARAVEAFGVSIPKYIDLAFDFRVPRAGFDGLIVEAKSGSQQYGQAVAQLRTYRSARQRRPGSRYLVLGIVESPNDPELTRDELAGFIAAAPSAEDLWLFSGADGIERTLMAVFGP